MTTHFPIEIISDRRVATLDLLESQGKVDPAALARAELLSARSGQPVEQLLNQIGALSDADLASAYATVSGLEVWDPSTLPPAIDLADLEVSAEFLRRHRALPLAQRDDQMLCAVCDPLDEEAVAGLKFALGEPLELLVARASDWRAELGRLPIGVDAAAGAAVDELRLARELDQVSDLGDEGHGARLVAAAFDAAIATGASDIHFEPRRNDFRVRFRVDGRLVDHQVVAADLAAPAVSRLKVIANLDLGEHRLPQDGRTSFVVGGRHVDVRVATSPSVFGESAVLRILDRNSVPLDIDALGFNASVSAVFRRAVTSPHGLFLVTGPTGSGKTTTLYALLQTFAGSPRKVLSVEDPVEYHFDHVSQTQVAPQIGLTFATALRSFLRQDPDVILVGEIRDPETATVAMQAAMTGHLVLASVHANDALAVVPRLLDIGIEPYQLAAGLRGVAAQRLVRRLCPSCRTHSPSAPEDMAAYAAVGLEPPLKVWRPSGCPGCKGEGFRGRIAIGEAFLTDAPLLRAIAEGHSAEALEPHARRGGLMTMIEDGAEKAQAGVTTLAEVLAAIHA